MKIAVRTLATVVVLLATTAMVLAQQPTIQNFREYDKEGTGVFEDPKTTDGEFDGLKVRLGGHFAQQFQGLSHSNTLIDIDNDGTFENELYALEPGLNLATANLNIDVQLAQGVRLNLITYLSSRHPPEA